MTQSPTINRKQPTRSSTVSSSTVTLLPVKLPQLPQQTFPHTRPQVTLPLSSPSALLSSMNPTHRPAISGISWKLARLHKYSFSRMAAPSQKISSLWDTRWRMTPKYFITRLRVLRVGRAVAMGRRRSRMSLVVVRRMQLQWTWVWPSWLLLSSL
jgi:hypothetical protein